MMFELLAMLVLLVNGNSAFPAEQIKDEHILAKQATDIKAYDDYFKDDYEIPSDDSASTAKFGGNRSDEFLYPPQTYYEQWAQEQREKDYWDNYC